MYTVPPNISPEPWRRKARVAYILALLFGHIFFTWISWPTIYAEAEQIGKYFTNLFLSDSVQVLYLGLGGLYGLTIFTAITIFARLWGVGFKYEAREFVVGFVSFNVTMLDQLVIQKYSSSVTAIMLSTLFAVGMVQIVAIYRKL